MQLLNHLFQKPSIAEEARIALTEAIESMTMDNDTGSEMLDQDIKMESIFKQTYTTFAFSKLPLIEPDTNRQVHDLPQLWEKVDQLIDRDEFFLSFAVHCKELDLPFMELDLDSAFIKAQAEWAEDIMISTANFILKWNEDVMLYSQVAFWEDGHIIVDTTKCTTYRDWLINNYLCELTNELSV